MIQTLAALAAAMAIAAGAFGAHGVSGVQADWLKTGAIYQLIHAVAVLTLSEKARGPALLMLGGSALFAVTLYLMALGAPRWLGAITPVGGAAMIAAWLWFAFKR
jgi:uncharacterized membrane protein YgdD (TMEM256/DUF423 family)